MNIDWEFALVRALLGVLGLGLALWWWRGRSAGGESRRTRRLRTIALVLLGVASYASFYFFFQLRHPGGFEPEDAFTYYVGSKYFPELGYYGIYDATLLALVEQKRQELGALEKVRDLRDMRTYPPRRAIARAAQVRQNFSEARWAQFSRDVRYFRERMKDEQFAHLVMDHGYHPSPVWTLMGRLFSTRVDPGPGFIRLIHVDRVLVLVALLACGWAFGPEVGALAAIVWGTGFLWRYGWVGDSFLRQSWFAAALIGLALARRGWVTASAVSLALSAWLRIFPGLFAVGWLAGAGFRSVSERKLAPGVLRFVLAGALTSLVLVGASLGVSPERASLYPEFVRKIAKFERGSALNKMGLGVVEQALLEAGPRQSIAGTAVTRPAPWFRGTINVLRWLCLAAALFLFARALRRSEAWESAAASFALIPLLTEPTGYYYSFCVAAVLLGERRPRIAVFVLTACAAWAAAGLWLYREPSSYVAASAIAVTLCFAVLVEWGRPASTSYASASPAEEGAPMGTEISARK